MKKNIIIVVLLLTFALMAMFITHTQGEIENDVIYKESPSTQIDMLKRMVDIDIHSQKLMDIINLIGKPVEEVIHTARYGNSFVNKRTLVYPKGLHVVAQGTRVKEFRFFRSEYVLDNGINVGMSLEDALDIVGKPEKTINGSGLLVREMKEDNTLYTNIGHREGTAYIQIFDQKIKLFFRDYKVSAIYVFF